MLPFRTMSACCLLAVDVWSAYQTISTGVPPHESGSGISKAHSCHPNAFHSSPEAPGRLVMRQLFDERPSSRDGGIATVAESECRATHTGAQPSGNVRKNRPSSNGPAMATDSVRTPKRYLTRQDSDAGGPQIGKHGNQQHGPQHMRFFRHGSTGVGSGPSSVESRLTSSTPVIGWAATPPRSVASPPPARGAGRRARPGRGRSSTGGACTRGRRPFA